MNEEKITKGSIFDFDGTTMDTLEMESGKAIYKEKSGKDWPHKGWWGRIESLDMSIFDFKPKPEVMADYKREVVNKNTLTVSLTGRRPKLGDSVKAILDANGYKFDRYMFNYGSDTLSNKIEQMGKLLKEFPNMRELELWDDRVEHFSTFNQWGNDLVKNGRLNSFKLNEVHNPYWSK